MDYRTNEIHCVSKKRANFETVQLKIIKTDFDEIWKKYSKYSRIEFACFSFRVGLLFYQIFVFQTGHRKYTVSKLAHFFETQCRVKS